MIYVQNVLEYNYVTEIYDKYYAGKETNLQRGMMYVQNIVEYNYVTKNYDKYYAEKEINLQRRMILTD